MYKHVFEILYFPRRVSNAVFSQYVLSRFGRRNKDGRRKSEDEIPNRLRTLSLLL